VHACRFSKGKACKLDEETMDTVLWIFNVVG